METGANGLKILQHRREQLLTNRRRNQRTLLGALKIQILPDRPPGPTHRSGPSTTTGNHQWKKRHERCGQPQDNRIQQEDSHVHALHHIAHSRDKEPSSRRRVKGAGRRP